MNARTAGFAQFQMAGDEVGMEVRQDDVPNGQAEALRLIQVDADVTPRIDHDGGTRGFVPEQVGGLGQTGEVVLVENHPCSSLCSSSCACWRRRQASHRPQARPAWSGS